MRKFYVGDFVKIDYRVIERKCVELLRNRQFRQEQKWAGYKNVTFEVIGVDENNLIIIRDPELHEIHISGRALILV